MIDLSGKILKTLGFSLPYCGNGVTVPTSIKLKFWSNKPGKASAFLSKPAANPIGLDKLKPKIFVSNKLL